MLPIIDLHQDLLSHLKYRAKLGQHDQSSFEMAAEANIRCLIATAFPLPPRNNFYDPITNQQIEEELAEYQHYCKKSEVWNLIRNKSDFEQALQGPKRGIISHIEGIHVLTRPIDELLSDWYALGLRSLGPVWNLETPLGGGTHADGIGLTEDGEKAIRFAETNGMILDFAHMNQETFFDTVAIWSGPIYISHGNCSAICMNKRNYSDAQLQIIKERDGVIGLFLAAKYVDASGKAEIYDVIRHAKHMKQMIGAEHIAIGSDFGGILSGCVNGLRSVLDLPFLLEQFKLHGFTEEEVEGIAYKNAARVIRKMLK
ncbi:MAG: membrane dipeptidase [bacterium]|nr:membrane dipeptidase [bacterium]